MRNPKAMKKQVSRALIDDEPSLPPIQPIHQVGVEMRVNFYGHPSINPNETMYKKTTNKLDRTQKADYLLLGKRMG